MRQRLIVQLYGGRLGWRHRMLQQGETRRRKIGRRRRINAMNGAHADALARARCMPRQRGQIVVFTRRRRRLIAKSKMAAIAEAGIAQLLLIVVLLMRGQRCRWQLRHLLLLLPRARKYLVRRAGRQLVYGPIAALRGRLLLLLLTVHVQHMIAAVVAIIVVVVALITALVHLEGVPYL